MDFDILLPKKIISDAQDAVHVYSVEINRSKHSRKLCDGCASTASIGDSCCLVLTLCADEIITINSENGFLATIILLSSSSVSIQVGSG